VVVKRKEREEKGVVKMCERERGKRNRERYNERRKRGIERERHCYRLP
jgi:hypothetical protein